MPAELSRHEQTVGRYLLFGQIGAGGMATVHVGRMLGPAGFAKLVAIKRLHPHLAKERAFVHAFLDEARIASRVQHPNVVSIDDVVIDGEEVLLVMEYVHGLSLSHLLAAERDRSRSVPPTIAGAIAVDVLQGLHAAHTAHDERGRPLRLVHRDVSPQNVLVGADGVSRVLDFGIAKALNRLQTTADGAVKGKLAYMAPERLLRDEETASVDVYAAGIVVWEMLSGERYFGGPSEPALIPRVIASTYRHLASPELGGLDSVLERAFRRTPDERYASCGDFALAIEREVVVASRLEVAEWVRSIAGDELAANRAAIAEIEQGSVPAIRTRQEDEPTRHVHDQLTESAVVKPTLPPETTRSVTPKAGSFRARAALGILGVVAGGAVVALGAASLSRPAEPLVSPAVGADHETVATPPTLEAVPTETTPPVALVRVGGPREVTKASRHPPRQAPADAGKPDASSSSKSKELEAPTDRK